MDDNKVVFENTITLRTTGSNIQTVCLGRDIQFINYDLTGANNSLSYSGFPDGVRPSFVSQGSLFMGGRPTAVGTYNFTITLSGPSGPSVTATGTITVVNDGCNAPTITLTSGSSSNRQTICLNTPITPITYSASATAIYTRLPPGVTGVQSGSNITISGTPTTTGFWDYIVGVSTAGGGASASGLIEVLPRQTVSPASSSPKLCVNTLLPTITHTTVSATGIGTPSGLPDGITASWTSNTIYINGTPNTTGVYNYSIPLTGSCGSVYAIGTITVDPGSFVSASPSPRTFCINRPMGISHSTFGITSISGSPSGLPSGVNVQLTANNLNITGTATESGVFNYTIPLNGSCSTIYATGSIIINPDSAVSTASNSPIVCVNTNLGTITHSTVGITNIGTPSGLPSGVNASWASNTVTISGTPSATGNFNYSIPLIGDCGTVYATGTITVNPGSFVSSSNSSSTFCINRPMGVAHSTFGITSISGSPSGLPSGVNVQLTANNLNITGMATETGVFNYSIPLSGSCSTVYATGIIIINPDSAVSAASASPTVYANTNLTAITHSTTGITNIAGTPSGLPLGVNAVWASNIVTISGTPSTTGTFNYTIPLAGDCGTVYAVGTINVLCAPITGTIKVLKNR
ncbi:hypothetical protein ACFSJW_18840 [Flavobacterium artemisiae]|uniref:Uncharacterized protein n=1 Tax=Flavobacterium artemisiae TaxID=2126556 RepID=A0ABW4HA46_9FLAO